MYTCHTHGWRSDESPCPSCQIVQDASGGEDVVFYVSQSPAPTKEGLEEAKEIIDDLLMNIPAQTEDQDWWESGLVKAVERAKAYIAGAQSSLQPSSPDPTVLVQAIIEAVDYLDEERFENGKPVYLNSIGATSILHKRMKEAINNYQNKSQCQKHESSI